MGFGSYALKRLLLIIPVLIVVSIGVFLLIKLTPGDPVNSLLPPQARTAENVARLEARLGLGEPIYVQYWRWLSNALQGDLGQSYAYQQPVVQMISTRLWPTIQLAFVAIVIALTIAIPTGVISAVAKDTWIDQVSRLVAFIGISIPAFWLGIIFVLIFSLFWQNWFGSVLVPAGGYTPPSQGLMQWFNAAIAPGVTLGVGYSALTSRQTRSAMVEVLNEDYIRTARSKGAGENVVVLVHGFRNALIPVVTVIGIQIGFLMNGAIVVEQVFQWPGIGQLLYQAVLQRDLPLIQGIILFIAMVFVLANLAVDLLYAYLDPRINYS